jgi:hypothetical protein
MAYYLGRDVDVYITTESLITNDCAIGTDADFNEVVCMSDSAATGATIGFAPSMASAAAVSGGRVSDLIGCDLSITASDEDIGPFFGHINTQKIASGRKETTVTLTKKKSDPVWDTIFNGPSATADFEGSNTEAARMGARFGLGSGSASAGGKIGEGLDFPANITDTAGVCYGYRVHVRLRDGDGTAFGQVYTVPNCAITGHSVTVNPDGTSEETMEWTSTVMPQQSNSTTAGTFNIAQTAVGQF